MTNSMLRRSWPSACVLLAALCLVGAHQEESSNTFSDTTMDLGIVVSDLDASIEFYTQVVGLQKTGGFSVPAPFCKAAGLTDSHPLDVTILTPNGDSAGTNIKLMAVPDADSNPTDSQFIHSQLGLSYLTFHVHDIDAAMQRVREHRVELVAKSLIPLGGQTRLSVIRDPDGNLVELVGQTAE